jgi:two-component sensor histidine kinase
MDHKKLLGLVITLLLGLSPLFAQKSNAKLILKVGDWFETDFRISNLTNLSEYRFQVRYELSTKTQNGDLAFKVSIERIKLKYTDKNNKLQGFDSYYPPYIENRKKSPIKQAYEVTANSNGKIVKVIASARTQNIYYSSSVNTKSTALKSGAPLDSFISVPQLTQLSQTIIKSVIDRSVLPRTINLPKAKIGNDIASAVLKLASFKVPANALIIGRITNRSDVDSLYEFNKKIFKFNKDGSFKANVSAGLNSRGLWVFGHFDEYKTFSVFLEPRDTLIVKADALNFEKTLSFGGNAAAKASLSKELEVIYANQWVNDSKYRSKSLQEFLAFQRQGEKALDSTLNVYTGRVSSEILSECRITFKYVQAGTKLQYLANNRSQVKPKISLVGFPKDFFLSIDTLPASIIGQERTLYSGYYLTWLLSYNKTKLNLLNEDQYGFYADYATAMASFKGFPLYKSISEALRKELHKSDLENTERLKNYYEDFVNNCGDTALTNRIKDLWTKARLWLPGNPSPVKTLSQLDGNTLDLSKFKGEPLVLIINNNNPEVLNDYADLIKKQDGNQVHFIIAQRIMAADWKPNQKLMDLPNVTYVALGSGEDKQRSYDLYYMQTKVFTFDSDFRIISGHLFDKYPSSDPVIRDSLEIKEVMQELIKGAIDSRIMTKEQKASLINTIGWSVGSALCTLVIVFLVYRARIAGIKKKTLLKNKIKDLEIKAIRSQMNPHFMFNALNSIQSLINNFQYKEANIYLEKFALLMRRVLNNSEKTFVSLSDELEAIVLYCELEKLRFNFKFEIKISPEVNTELIEIPGMIIQPLVENSIVHGLAQKGHIGYLVINISHEKNFLKIVIKDNGVGLKETASGDSNSLGLKLVKERLTLLSTEGNVGELHLSSNLQEHESGVTATLTIPID